MTFSFQQSGSCVRNILQADNEQGWFENLVGDVCFHGYDDPIQTDNGTGVYTGKHENSVGEVEENVK